MSNDDVGNAAQPANGQAGTSEITDFFNRVEASGFQPRLHNVTGSCRFDIVGAGVWRVTVKGGMPTVTRNDMDTSPADCVVTIAAEDFVRLVRGEGNLNVLAAWLQGLVTISGDTALASAFIGSYTLEPVGSQSR